MGADDPTAELGGVATASRALPQPRRSGRKRKPVSYDEDLADEALESPVKKPRGRPTAKDLSVSKVVSGAAAPEAAAPAKKPKAKAAVTEGRLRRYRDSAPQSYLTVKDRALTQRMYVIDRTRVGTDECPEEHVDIAGTTGNVYTVKIAQLPSCTCPHAKKGNQCKHIVYVLIRVLKAPEHIAYQLSLVPSELREIFSKAPPVLSEESAEGEVKDGKRKPIEGDCPVCCEEFQPGSEEIVYCKAACGNNIHKACFEQWAATKGNGKVTCPYCRTEWAGDEEMVKKIAKVGKKNADGYVNVAGELGLSGERDYSTYHSFWVRQQARDGLIDDSWRRFGLSRGF